MKKDAILSQDRKYRYVLSRIFSWISQDFCIFQTLGIFLFSLILCVIYVHSDSVKQIELDAYVC